MPRKPRFNLPGIPQHVIQRGNNREPCFFTKADYRWSSYAANAQGQQDPIVTPHPSYLALGSSAGKRQKAYRELFRQPMENQPLHEIRQALNGELVLGCSYFKDHIQDLTNRQARLGKPGRPRLKDTRGDSL